jgi:HEAT repeat protein
LAQNQQEQELITQLSSQKRSLVIQAVVKLSRSGKSQKALEALAGFVKSQDRELSFFAYQAAVKIAGKIKVDLKKFLQDVPESNHSSEISRADLLSPEKEKIAEILHKIRNSDKPFTPDLLPAVAIFLTKFGDISDAPFLEKHLANEDSTLILPFIDAAEKLAPAVFNRALPHLLASREPLVRSRAIRALQRIDAEEAERHFSDLLASRNPEDRLAGIGIAFLFPFKRVKDYILSLLPEEKDLDVLRACQTFLASNPELEAALGILDSIDSVSAEQKSRLNVIFKTVCQAIIATGVLPPEESRPEFIVKTWKKQRLASFLNDIEIQLAFSDDEKKAAIIKWIEKNRSHPQVKELIERLGNNPQTEKVFFLLTGPKSADVSAEEAATELSPNGEETTAIKKMRSLTLESFKSQRHWLLQCAENGPEKLRKEALTTILRLHPDNKLIDLAKNAINDKSVIVKTAAFKILARVDPDYLKDKISDFLQEDDANIRLRAVQFALKFKEKEAIVILKNMLKSPEQRLRANAVACLGLCPFDKVYKILLSQLDEENHPVIAKHITSILLANPSRIALRGLDNITRTSNPAVAMVISQARNDLFDLVSKLPAEEQPEKLQKIATENQKPYSVENVRQISRKRQKEWKPGYKADKESIKARLLASENFNWPMVISGAVLLVFVAMLPVMFFSSRSTKDKTGSAPPKDWRAGERKKFSASKVPDKFKMNRACSVFAVVEKITSDTSMIINHEQQKIMVKFDEPALSNLKSGTELVITMVPFRVNSQGIIQAKGTSFAISKGQEQ